MNRNHPHTAVRPSATRRNALLAAFGVIGLSGLLAPRAAHAYLDPISGSVLLQVVVAGVLASFFGVRRFFAGVAEQFRRRLGPPRK